MIKNNKSEYFNGYRKLLQIIFATLFYFNNSSAQQINFQKDSSIKYYGKDFYLIEGTSFSETEKESAFDRLPVRYKNKVKQEVWQLSKNSSGLSVRFMTNSPLVKVRWELTSFTGYMPHMPATGSMGIDLYCKTGETWQFVNTAIPRGKLNECLLIENMKQEWREFRMFLPLFNGIIRLEIGIDSQGEMHKSEKTEKRPVVFYGTSITQGGCASRPGMAYTNIISRKLGLDCINLGFSGNGIMDQEIAELISEIDASLYVIDCIPNLTETQIFANAFPFVEQVRKNCPETPIILVVSPAPPDTFFNVQSADGFSKKCSAMKNEYERMISAGMRNVYYLNNENLTGNDHEATVDGIHFTDLGFMRFADCFVEMMKKIN